MNTLASPPGTGASALAPAEPASITGSVFGDMWQPRPSAMPAGETFDAVRVARHHGELALKRLRRFASLPIGAVLADGDEWWFFIPPHFDETPWPRATRYLSTGSFITVPPPQHTRSSGYDLGWIQHGSPGREFTSPLFLRPVIEALID